MVRCIDLDEEEAYEGEDRALTRWMYPYQDENGKERWSKECPAYVSPFVAWKRRLQEEREREEQAMSEMGMVRL